MTLLDCPTAAAWPIDPARMLPALRRGLWDRPAGSLVRLLDYRVRITDGPNAYMQYKDVFVRGIYRFTADRPDPLIIDGGSNMGISILGFKRDHPGCRIIGFEPDPQIFQMLKDNLARNDAAAGGSPRGPAAARSASSAFPATCTSRSIS